MKKEDFKAEQRKYFILLLAVMLSGLYLIITMNKWANRKGAGVCIPLSEHVFPLIPYMPVSTEEQDNAKLYTFIEKYIKTTFDERIIDYHKPSNLGRYNNALLRTSLQESISMSMGEAQKENMKKYANSDETMRRLRACNCGWIFNITAIESIQKTNFNGVIHATIIGEFQVTYDSVKTSVPHSLFGFKRIWLTIAQGRPSKDTKGRYINEYGLYVTAQEFEDISYDARDRMNAVMFDKGFYIK